MKNGVSKPQRKKEESSLIAVHISSISWNRVPYPPGYQIPPFSIFDGRGCPKRHWSHCITACRDTTTKWVFAIDWDNFPFPFPWSCLRVVWQSQAQVHIKLERDAKGLGKHSGQRIKKANQTKMSSSSPFAKQRLIKRPPSFRKVVGSGQTKTVLLQERRNLLFSFSILFEKDLILILGWLTAAIGKKTTLSDSVGSFDLCSKKEISFLVWFWEERKRSVSGRGNHPPFAGLVRSWQRAIFIESDSLFLRIPSFH